MSSPNVNAKSTQLMDAIMEAGDEGLIDADSAGLAHDLVEVVAKHLAYGRYDEACDALIEIMDGLEEEDDEEGE